MTELKLSHSEERDLPNGVKQTWIYFDDANSISRVKVFIEVGHEKYSDYEVRFKNLMKQLLK